jgi:hypothetical protein
MKLRAMNVSTTTASRGRRLAALAFGATLSVLASSAAWAQMMGNSPGSGTPTRAGGHSQEMQDKPPEQPPNPIPGSKPRTPAAPATKPVGDMQPTDALFDAINRGDVAAAREALNRGADMNGVNVLGMTPMELSVDLGRNDISFLLLSMRGEDSNRGSRALGRGVTPTPASQTARIGRPAGPGKAVAAKAAPSAHAQTRAKPPATPKQFATDGGTPLPGAGFLGFDPRSASN